MTLDTNTRGALEAILMITDAPVSLVALATALECPVKEVRDAVLALKAEYDGQDGAAPRGFELREVGGGWRIFVRQEFDWAVKLFVANENPTRLSQAALETLAVIAYKQPISRGQVAAIRGVDPDAVMRTLHARGYITEVGRDDGPGQAVLYGTTPLFLERLGLESIEALPSIAEFVPDARVVEALEQGLRIVPQATPDVEQA